MSAPMALTLDERADWRRTADAAIARLAATRRPFTADDLRAEGINEPGHPNAWGPAFRDAHKNHIIRRIGYQSARRRTRHASTLTVWLGSTPKEQS